jgi:hypothetical protein
LVALSGQEKIAFQAAKLYTPIWAGGILVLFDIDIDIVVYYGKPFKCKKREPIKRLSLS